MIVSWCGGEENRLINIHNTKQKRRFSQHLEKSNSVLQRKVQEYGFSRRRGTEKRYDKDHISCHKLIGWTHDQWPIQQLEHHQSVLCPFFTRDKEASVTIRNQYEYGAL